MPRRILIAQDLSHFRDRDRLYHASNHTGEFFFPVETLYKLCECDKKNFWKRLPKRKYEFVLISCEDFYGHYKTAAVGFQDARNIIQFLNPAFLERYDDLSMFLRFSTRSNNMLRTPNKIPPSVGYLYDSSDDIERYFQGKYPQLDEELCLLSQERKNSK